MQYFHLYSKLLPFHRKLTKSRKRLVENLGLGDWQSFTHNKSPFELKVRSIYLCQTRFFQEVLTYRLETCDFVSKCFAKISPREFPNDSKRVTVQEHT